MDQADGFKTPSYGTADRLLPTLLDRLTDNAPQRDKDAVSERTVTRKQLRQIILRDLSWLLNATNAEAELALADFPDARSSTLNFGLPAFSGKRVSDVKLSDLEKAIEGAIQRFEPRVMPQTLTVNANVASDDEAAHNMVVFEIRGQIWAHPYPIEMLLKSSIDLETGSVTLLDQMGDN
ncbi:type VI secretion system baseplate subunit TssE [Diaphorobacter aerolatus]|uniref:Type VI secretion system baseplate subunit TssE n=1 Tax=Diaphorobacter aerolatus TaxID=1288495 RepID=A0A7H0GLD1_9BURK|nr:type VI secretion system baseplate subunit TssE [Diaphorobacter aerolatus]QNP49097.1 type VI secretion system baseplate subunit TssE [Diaphorobacter aerolatus]